MRKILVPLTLVLLVFAGCASNNGTPIRQVWDLERDYIKIATPVATYVESQGAEPAVKATLQALSAMAYESIQEAKILAGGGARDEIVEDAIDRAGDAVKEFRQYAVDQLTGAVR